MFNLEFDLRSPCDIPTDEKQTMPVSFSYGPDNVTHVVSRFGDEVWDFFPYIPQFNIIGAQKVIKWSVLLPDGNLLTSPTHASLLQSSKDFIWSLFSRPIEGKKRPLMTTLIARFELLIPLLRWMVANGIEAFRDLDGRCLEYVPFAANSTVMRKRVASSTIHYRLAILESLYLQRNKIADSIQKHPWPNETALALSGTKRDFAHRIPSTKLIPPDVLNKLMQTAIEYVTTRSKKILSVLADAEVAHHTNRRLLVQSEVDLRTLTARKAGFTGMSHLRKEGIALRSACYIVIDMFSGLRDSEMMSLNYDCMSHGPSDDGLIELYWIHGEIYKTGHRRKKWLVPEIVDKAVLVLEQLTVKLRAQLQQNLLELTNQKKLLNGELNKKIHLFHSQKEKLFLCSSTKLGNNVSVLGGKTLNHNLKDFCADNNICGVDGRPYPLHAHQFRRTYAHLLAKAELGDLLTLRDHFGHWSLDMTAYYAHGAFDDLKSDKELLEMVAVEKSIRQEEIITEWITTDKPLANGNLWLDEWRTKVRTAKDKKEAIKRYAGTITLNGTGHSWCVGNAKGMNCGGLCVFQAQSCVNCKYGVIGPEHKPIWTGIRDQQDEVLALDDIGPGGKARALEIRILAEKVLSRLNGKTGEEK